MSYQQQTMFEKFGPPPPMKEKARLRLCDKCIPHGIEVYLYWGDTGVPKKNKPDETIVLPVEHKTGQWHECPYKEKYNGNSGAQAQAQVQQQPPPRTQSYTTMQPQPQYQRPTNIPPPDFNNLQGYLQSLVDQNKTIMQYNQSLVAALNHAVEYLEIIAESAKSKPQIVSIGDEGQEYDKVNLGDATPRTFDTITESTGKKISLEDAKNLNEETDAAIEKEYQEYKEKFG